MPDPDPFVLELTAVLSQLAALETASDLPGYSTALPHLGMARSELALLVSPTELHPVDVTDLTASIAEVRSAVHSLMVRSTDLARTLRLSAALEHLQTALVPEPSQWR